MKIVARGAVVVAGALVAGGLTSLGATPAHSVVDRIHDVVPRTSTNDRNTRTLVTFTITDPMPQDPRTTRVDIIRSDSTRTDIIAGAVPSCENDAGATTPQATANPGTPSPTASVNPGAGTPTPGATLNTANPTGGPSVNPGVSTPSPGITANPGAPSPTASVNPGSTPRPTSNCPPTTTIRAYFALGDTNNGDDTRSVGTPDTNAPANASLYDAFVYPTNVPRDDGDVCTQCFQVVQGGQVTVASVAPTQLVAGTTGQEFVVRGDNFARGSTVEALFAGTTVVDSSISFPQMVNAAGTGREPNTTTHRKTSIRRAFEVAGSAAPGPRDIRVRNIGGSAGVLLNGLTISPIFVSGISPGGGVNSNSAVRTTITGRIPEGSIGQLVGLTTPTTALVIEGTTVVPTANAIQVVFNLTGAPAGRYRVRVLSPDRGYSSADACSPTFNVVDAQGRAGTVTAPSGSTTCSAYSGPGASPSPSGSASGSPGGSPQPTDCGPGTGVACPSSPSPSGSATGSPTGSPIGSPTGTRPATATAGPTTGTATATPPPPDTRQPTRLTLSASRPTIYSGESISLSGQLFKSDGTPIAGETVQVQGRVYPASSATPAGTAVTDSNGVFVLHGLRPVRGADYVATYNGSNSRDLARATSNSVHVNVKTLITVTSPRSGSVISRTRPLVVFGGTRPAKPGSVIALQMRTGTSTRKIIAIGRVASNGSFEIHRYRDTPMPAGRYTLQVTIGPATGNSASASKEFLLYVR